MQREARKIGSERRLERRLDVSIYRGWVGHKASQLGKQVSEVLEIDFLDNGEVLWQTVAVWRVLRLCLVD